MRSRGSRWRLEFCENPHRMNKPRLIRELELILPPRSVLSNAQDLALYEYDGALDRGRPDVVVFPATTEHVSAIAQVAFMGLLTERKDSMEARST